MEHLEAEIGRTGDSIDVNFTGHNFKHLFEPSRANSPRDIAYFNSFPERAGLTFENGQPKTSGGEMKRKADILQIWLFFGLIFTVVQKNGESLLDYDKLLTNRGNDKITTRYLNPALQEWAAFEFEEAKTNKNAVRMRMIRLNLVLARARRVIRSCCSYDSTPSDLLWMESEKYSDNSREDDYLSDAVAMSLMLLGETLSTVKDNIMKKLETNENRKDCIKRVDGWHNDEDPGWGQPRYVVTRMWEKGWCRRTVFLLRQQFGLNATLMLNAYNVYKGSIHWDGNKHSECTETRCLVKSEIWEDSRNSMVYATAHHEICRLKRRHDCEKEKQLGPMITDIEAILDSDGDTYPLLKFRMNGSKIDGLDVVVAGQETRLHEYVTISHVWSDGYGNELANSLWRCQLEYIRDLLHKACNNSNILFWMDTLAIPVDSRTEEARQRKKKAIGQIYRIFRKAKYCVVLDKGLVHMDKGLDDEPCQAAMKILASNWMRRLWTLQEAFLSNQIMVAFRDSSSANPLHDIDGLVKEMEAQANDVKSVLPSLLNREITDNIMRSGSRRRWLDDEFLDAEGRRREKLTLISDSWRAARWRTTSNQAHETLALATLLGLQSTEHSSEDIAMAGAKRWPWDKAPEKKDIEHLMCEFWRTVDRTTRGAIPPGIIFLPGDKVSRTGFGWAPRTFMNSYGIDHPDPLSLLKQQTVLVPGKGLTVNCPGFFLHMDNHTNTRKEILQTSTYFSFPVDSTFVEWYQVKADESVGQNKFAAAVVARSTPLAIILSRQSPREYPTEIGLLVEIYDTAHDQDIEIFHVQVLFRVWVGRLNRGPETDQLQEDPNLFGEAISMKNVRWCVDGFNPERFQSQPANANPNSRSGMQNVATSFLQRVRTFGRAQA